MTNIFQRIRIFGHETMLELKKAVWPTKMELRDSTFVVMIAAILLAIAILIADWSVFNWVNMLSKLVNPAYGVVESGG